MTMAPVPAFVAVLFCAALFVLLFQHLFPRPAPWRLAGAALVAGIVCTILLGLILRQLVATGRTSFEGLSTISAALPFAVLRVALPEEGAKALAALAALAPFWRRVTPAQAFQASLFVAVGFAIVENQGYAAVFDEYAMLMAFGRGFLATLTHSLLAMIFGRFLMRFAAGGWRGWHLPLIGYLAAAGCHALYDAGMLPILSEFLRTRTVTVPMMMGAVPIVLGGILLVLIAGLWSLRSAIRRAAADDAIAAYPRHQTIVRRWRRSGNVLLLLGFAGLIAAIAWSAFAQAPGAGEPELGDALLSAIGFTSGAFAMILGWVLRQKR